MSGELLFSFDATRGRFDLEPAGMAADADAALYSAVLASLFTDARARPEDRLPAEPRIDAVYDPGLPPPAERNRRGWWGNRNIGSLLWLLGRETMTERARLSAEDYARQALAWLVTDRVASAVLVSASLVAPDSLHLHVRIERPGRPALEYRFEPAWRGVERIGESGGGNAA